MRIFAWISSCDAEWQRCYNDKLSQFRKSEVAFYEKIATVQSSVSVDTFFTVRHLLDTKGDFITSALLEAFPQFSAIIHMIRALDVKDVKELVTEWTKWADIARERVVTTGARQTRPSC